MTWGRRTIEAVLGREHEVPLIVHTQSDNAYEKIFNESVAELAADRGIQVLVRTRADDDEVRAAIAAARAATSWSCRTGAPGCRRRSSPSRGWAP